MDWKSSTQQFCLCSNFYPNGQSRRFTFSHFLSGIIWICSLLGMSSLESWKTSKATVTLNSNTQYHYFQPKFQEVHFFPTSLTQLRIEDDVRQFMEDTAKIFHDTGFPPFPWVLISMLLGFSLCFVGFGGLFIIFSVLSIVLMMLPIFIHLYYMYQRKSKLSKIVVDYNNEKFLEKGFYVGKKSCFSYLNIFFSCISLF